MSSPFLLAPQRAPVSVLQTLNGRKDWLGDVIVVTNPLPTSLHRDPQGQEEACVATAPPVVTDVELEQATVSQTEGLTFSISLVVPVAFLHTHDLVLVQEYLSLIRDVHTHRKHLSCLRECERLNPSLLDLLDDPRLLIDGLAGAIALAFWVGTVALRLIPIIDELDLEMPRPIAHHVRIRAAARTLGVDSRLTHDSS